MVSGDNFSDGYLKTRPVLADVTNRPGKRAISLISDDSASKSGRGHSKTDADDGDSHFTKQVCLGVDNLVKERCKSFGVNCNDKILSLRKSKQACGFLGIDHGVRGSSQIVSSDNSNQPNDKKQGCNLLDSSVQIVRDSTKHGMEHGNATRDSCISSISTPACSRSLAETSFGYREKGSYHEDRPANGDSPCIPSREGLFDHACENDNRDLFVGNTAASKCRPTEWPAISSSQDSKFPGLERCVGLKGDGGANSMASGDLLKSCCCALCSKAAYIWADLHYQDIKGRLAALKKNHKEASMLVQKFSGEKEALIHDQGNSKESSKLELYLTDQWRSLFGYMETALAHESSQLESSFDTLKDLRERCKNDDKGQADNH
ncbi:hypothetical protein L6164_025134 [Bauhinia variegata]|uniref:Uncharacterized protein n=1 Tax=Bauhinia variegata TaxID=167791 RepID=A0ACB9M101_BAUVA|nr:hypothetical protein L6164_025134 [Bauhinia variegata]